MGHALDQNDNVNNDMKLKKIYKLKKLIKTTLWNYDVMIAKIMKYLQHRQSLYTWVISFCTFS